MSTVPPELNRLGYLLKHARERLSELTSAALAPHGVDGRELAVLQVIAGSEPPSQHEAAQRLGVDRTTMVALLDVLQDKGLVVRKPHEHDRRKNVVVLTERGKITRADAVRAYDEAEREFLAALPDGDGERLRTTLVTLLET